METTPSVYLPVAARAFFHEKLSRLYAKVGLGALGQTLPPLPSRQLLLYSGENHRAHGAVVLPLMAAQSLVESIRYVLDLQVSHVRTIV